MSTDQRAKKKTNDINNFDSDKKILEMKKVLEYSSTWFYVTQKVYEELLAYPDLDLRINTSPKKGNHPKGYYYLPNKFAKSFIESKQGTFNWDKNHDFKQDSVPLDIKDYFKTTWF